MCITVEDAATLCDLDIEFKVSENRNVQKVVLAPDGRELDFTVQNDTILIKLPRMDGYALIKIIYC